jgi:hypothetical protein
MFFMTESTNPFDYMSSLWYVLMGVLILFALLLLIARPLHRFYTDRKTRTIIQEAGVEDEPGPSARGGEEDEEGGDEES